LATGQPGFFRLLLGGHVGDEVGGFGLGLFVGSRLCQACDGDLAINAIEGKTVAEATFRSRNGAPAPTQQVGGGW
jgi:hypothetical protein